MSSHDNTGCPDLRRAFDLLRSCHRALFASLNEKDLLRAICDAIVANGRYIGARIDLVPDTLSCEDRQEASAGAGSDSLQEGASAGVEDGHCGGEPCSPNLALPLREEGRLIGTLSLYAGSLDTLADGEMDLLQEVADEVAFGIGYMRLIERWQRLAAVVEAAPEAIGFTDAADPPRCTYLNPAGRHLIGEHSDGELRGLFDAHPGWAQQRLREEILPRAMAEGSWRGESVVLGDDGQEIPVEQTVVAHRDANGRVKQFSTLMRDIWDRKRAEEALRREALHAESMTQALFDALPGMVFLLDEHGQLLRWNQELERLARLPARELPGVGPGQLFPSEPSGRFEDVFRQALEEEAAAAEIQLVTSKGLVTHLFRSLRITIDGLPLVLSIAMDIQDCKAAEERSRLAATVFEAVFVEVAER